MNAKNILISIIIVTFVILVYALHQRASYIDKIRYEEKVKNDTSSTYTQRGVIKEILNPEITLSNKKYIVKKGDTLWDIAEKSYGLGFKYHKIIEKNPGKTFKFLNGNQGLIHVGTELIL